ncbi:MAG: lactate utilization protein [Planctomycetes bacterium]|nr:lactate utilization protein [Planctomycetota bacterium]
MSDSERDAFLARVRQAVQAGNRPGSAAPLRERGTLGYQGGGEDLVATFCREFEAAGGHAHVVPTDRDSVGVVLDLVLAASARRVLLGTGPVLDRLEIRLALSQAGCAVYGFEGLTAESARHPLFAADAGISGVAYLIAETGTLVVESSPAEPRSLSLLPPLHIVVAGRDQILPDLFDLFAPGRRPDERSLPSCLSLITGPSKTGDIELRLVTGVHGPGEVHVVLIDARDTSSPAP